MEKGTKAVGIAAALVAVLVGFSFLHPGILQSIPRSLEPRVIWETAYFHIGNLKVTPELLTGSVVFLILLSFVTHAFRRFLRREVLRHTSLDEGQRYAIERTAGYVLFALGLLVGLQIVGLNLNNLAFLGGAFGIGIGFGFQNIASNFASGLILLIERPIKVGDRIEVGGLNGDVIRIGGRSTWVRTNDNLIIIVPNAEFTTNRVINWTANDRQVRFSFPLGVAYGSDLELTRGLLLKIALQHPDVLPHPEPELLLVNFGDSAIGLELRVWSVAAIQRPSRLKSDLYFAVLREFDAHGIEIPFPQHDVHLKPEPPAAAGGAAGSS